MTGQRDEEHRPRRWVALAYVALLALTVPWYWPPGDTRHFHGLPFWALATLLAVFATSVFTAWLYLSSPDDGSE